MRIYKRPSIYSGKAAEWWVRLQTKDLPLTEREMFVDWLRESPVHVSEMLRVAQVHNALEQFKHWTNVPTTSSDETIVSLTHPHVRTRRLALWTSARRIVPVAAAAVAVCIMTIRWFSSSDTSIRTHLGERREVALADGSVLEIDPASELELKFDANFRRVVLNRGRVFFRVAKDKTKPFLVETNRTTVRAVGTAFGVERDSEQIVVTVLEGTVSVFPRSVGGQNAHGAPGSDAIDRATLHPGATDSTSRRTSTYGALPETFGETEATGVFVSADQQTTVHGPGNADPPRSVDGAKELAWAQGRLVFQNSLVSDVVSQFNRYNRVQLRVSGASLADEAVTGVFNASDPEAFIAFLNSVASVKVTRVKDNEIILSRIK
jgi:transmembrane sensor